MEFEEQIAKVKKPEENLLEGLEKEYCKIGDKFGYMPVQSPLFLCLKKKDSQVGFEVQFGGEEKFQESMKKLSESGSDLCIFITSSKAHTMRLEDARALLLRKFEIKEQKYMFVDIETGRYVNANKEWEKFSSQVMRPDWAKPGPMPRRPIFRIRKKGGRQKKIYGKRKKGKNWEKS
ncbi:MAG: hypothetical protein ABIH83_04560 [Candidatus Micrarchaeota archaeon]